MFSIAIYGIGGCLFGYGVDKMITTMDEEDKFTIGESLAVITMWPIFAFIIVFSFLKGLVE